MSKLEVAKEQIAYLKLWLGIIAVTEISLMGWLASNLSDAPTHRVITAIIFIIAIAYAVYRIHRNIERRIEALEDL